MKNKHVSYIHRNFFSKIDDRIGSIAFRTKVSHSDVVSSLLQVSSNTKSNIFHKSDTIKRSNLSVFIELFNFYNLGNSFKNEVINIHNYAQYYVELKKKNVQVCAYFLADLNIFDLL